jgi:hypothetical protein
VNYLRQLGIAVDQLANAILMGFADETLSARAWRSRNGFFARIFRPVIDVLFFWQKPDPEVNMLVGRVVTSHCEQAYWKEKLRRDHAPEYR